MNKQEKIIAKDLRIRLNASAKSHIPLQLRDDLLAFLDGKQRVKCGVCHGSGERCHSGSAHPSNWYDCDKCNGTGRLTV